MQEEIGSTAGIIWEALDRRGELSLGQLKKEVKVTFLVEAICVHDKHGSS